MKSPFGESKRGNVFIEVMVAFIVIACVVWVVIMGKGLLNDINTDIQADASIGNTTKELIGNTNTYYLSFWDNLLLFLFIGFWVATLLLAFLIDTHPAFFVISLILLIVSVIVMGYVSNVNDEIQSESDIAAYGAQMVKIGYILSNLPIVALIMAITIGGALYAKSQI